MTNFSSEYTTIVNKFSLFLNCYSSKNITIRFSLIIRIVLYFSIELLYYITTSFQISTRSSFKNERFRSNFLWKEIGFRQMYGAPSVWITRWLRSACAGTARSSYKRPSAAQAQERLLQ